MSQLATVNHAADEMGMIGCPVQLKPGNEREYLACAPKKLNLPPADNPEDVKKYQDRPMKQSSNSRNTTLLLKYADQPGRKQALDEGLAAFNEYVQISNKIGNLAREGNTAGAVATVAHWSPSKANKKIRDLVDKIVDDHIAGGKQAFAESSATYKRAQTWVVGVIIAAIVIGMILALWLARIVSTPLQEAVEFAESIAHGDLTRTIVPSSSCERVS